MDIANLDTPLTKQLFGDDFAWGVSTAALQIEGACDADGKGPSIWDTFSARKGKILNGDKPHKACDFYSRYEQDIDLVKELNIPNFRFSIAWSRILPDGTGNINQAGVNHYNKVINYCLKQGIEPWITLYHWDLPQALEDKGGWTNREIVNWFSNFVTVCAQNFGDRVKHWMVMNEPAVFTGAGYFLGIHAPGRMGLRNFLPAIHHVVLSIVAGARLLRQMVPLAQIGNTFSCSYIEPYADKPRHIKAAKRADALINRLYIEPLLGLGYPTDEVSALKGIYKYVQPGDEANMSFDFDFIGIQNYTREIVKYSFFTPYIGASLVKAENRGVELTDMKWEVYPPAIYQMIKKFNAYPQIKKLIITENGAAFPDVVFDGKVDDQRRVNYLKTHLQQVLKAKQEGYDVHGYFVWTLTDNFEWAEGYHPRFGLIHIDFNTQQRIIKSSGYWYAHLLR
ncbi:GH1 family beta-glucosidase [Mucilaginibacter phyllosphaerae]|uniref:Beta-glucosidase n=1 Tax=Mucilaginibacter phyllosphaerae TaxID=1812349 RepID=A0A4Y8AC84_9SPHI|nr:GH1 family beta-glucosidase [Mucilaginibacter phyllosphaerae]MBB3969066.1 beta-glucosidase [Mucilaginibacter phyllosphaerae]TEW66115.1 beta-glucosidase [Mucilaginibacter phyllosphaerae]GGH06030.1 beta-glucosidase [Mucilaginibacter phyllosphaerae]